MGVRTNYSEVQILVWEDFFGTGDLITEWLPFYFV